jgi:anti-sigma factor RsiW
VSCDPERVTAYVDEALDDAGREEVRAHLEGCAACSAQAAFERGLRERLRSLPAAEPRPELEAAIRARLRSAPRPWRLLLPVAAAVAIVLWGRGAAPFVAWELARDHARCFSMERLPAEVWSGEPAEIAAWFERQGTPLPLLPARGAGLELVGARFCGVGDRRVAHVYYEGEERRLSLFLVPGPVRFEDGWTVEVHGRTVGFVRAARSTVALVSERPQDVQAFERAFSTTMARAEAAPVTPP